MGSRLLYSVLKTVAVVMGVMFIVWALYDQVIGRDPLDIAWEDAERLFEDGQYQRAALAFEDILAEQPDHVFASKGLARSRHLSGAHEDALAAYDDVLARDSSQADVWANRGILLDTMGRHEEALVDYQRALSLDPEIADGPSWLTRFLRKQADAPPTIADRAAYLYLELQKPEHERLLSVPEIDDAQRHYRQ